MRKSSTASGIISLTSCQSLGLFPLPGAVGNTAPLRCASFATLAIAGNISGSMAKLGTTSSTRGFKGATWTSSFQVHKLTINPLIRSRAGHHNHIQLQLLQLPYRYHPYHTI
ncbi:hypothetical protein BDR04DRAFT_766293 [Suillus decipiens]|nr:hypothetical protein BDR04DRAFT_766293 [Suillus decipiens]